MKRATVTLPDDLKIRLDTYLAAQPVTPSFSKVVQTALERFLEEQTMQQELEKRGYEPPRWPVTFPVDEKGSGKRDISVNHDKYLAEGTKNS